MMRGMTALDAGPQDDLRGELRAELTSALQRVPELAGRELSFIALSGGITNRNYLVSTPDGAKLVHATDAAPSSYDIEQVAGKPGRPGDEVYVECAAPFGDDLVLMGRRGGPEFLDSELARLEHLLGLATTISH